VDAFLSSIGYDQWVVHALLAIPLVGALLVGLIPDAHIKVTALVVSLVELVVSLGLWWAFEPTAEMQFTSAAPWIPYWGINYSVGIDGISLFMVLLTTVLIPLCVLGSWNYITERRRGYYALLLTLTTGILGVFVAMDLFLFYVAWEVMLIPMYFIIGVWGGGNRLYAAIKFFLYTMFGSLLMLVAILVVYLSVGRATGVYDFDYYHLLANISAVEPHAFWLFIAFFLAFAIKVPIFPFHTWLPDAHVEAPTAGSVILAGVLLKMGTYGFLRFAVPFFPGVAMSPEIQSLILVLAVVGIIYGALVALVQPDVKKLVAYSSVSHLGFVMLGIWTITIQSVQGALMVMINHGISTGALFFLVGMLYERRHSREIADFGGIARTVPMLAAAFMIVALSSIGLPGTNGFIGEFLVLLGSWSRAPWATAIATTGVIFAAGYLLWALQRVFFNPLDKKENEGLIDLSAREVLILAPLLAFIVWIGVYPKPFLDRMEPAAQAFIQQTIDGSDGQVAASPATAQPAE
jgi:NADH-quinone oxidoreductase subunit M